MIKRALLIADLEGVAGVDSTLSLAFGGPGHEQAREWLTEEVNACVEGLLRAGFDRVRVSDSHLSGSDGTSLLESKLNSAVELRLSSPDLYGGALLDQVTGVACVGMHAAAQTNGFAAHTILPHLALSWAGKPVSETDAAFFLAGERGVPALYTSGDDVLAASTTLPCVVTKQAVTPSQAKSLPRAEVLDRLRRAAGSPPVYVEVPRVKELLVRFKRAAWCDAAERVGGKRVSKVELSVAGDGFTQAYEEMLRIVEAAGGVLADEVTAQPGSPEFAQQAEKLLLEPFEAL